MTNLRNWEMCEDFDLKCQREVYESHLHSNQVGNLRVCGPDKLRTAENTVFKAEQSAAGMFLSFTLANKAKPVPV